MNWVSGKFCLFFRAVPGSIKNHLNMQELARILAASLTTGCGLFGTLEAVAAQVGVIFPASADAALAALVLTILLETHRRLGHGEELVRPPARPARRAP